jgi:hypothetical protein
VFRDINLEPTPVARFGANIEDVRRRLHGVDAAACRSWSLRFAYDHFANAFYAWNHRSGHWWPKAQRSASAFSSDARRHLSNETGGRRQLHRADELDQKRTIAVPPTLQLVRAVATDIPFIVATERRPGYEDVVGRWDEDHHRRTLADPRHAYFIARVGGSPIGFSIVRD